MMMIMMMMMMIMIMMICCNHHNCLLLLLFLLTPFLFLCGAIDKKSQTPYPFTQCVLLHIQTVPSPVLNILAEPFCSWSSHTHLLYVPLSIHVLCTYVARQTAVDSFSLHSVNNIWIIPCYAPILLLDPVTCSVSLQ